MVNAAEAGALEDLENTNAVTQAGPRCYTHCIVHCHLQVSHHTGHRIRMAFFHRTKYSDAIVDL